MSSFVQYQLFLLIFKLGYIIMDIYYGPVSDVLLILTESLINAQ